MRKFNFLLVNKEFFQASKQEGEATAEEAKMEEAKMEEALLQFILEKRRKVILIVGLVCMHLRGSPESAYHCMNDGDEEDLMTEEDEAVIKRVIAASPAPAEASGACCCGRDGTVEGSTLVPVMLNELSMDLFKLTNQHPDYEGCPVNLHLNMLREMDKCLTGISKAFNEAQELRDTPMPFPYVQVKELLNKYTVCPVGTVATYIGSLEGVYPEIWMRTYCEYGKYSL